MKGKTFEEKWGKEKAKKIFKKMSDSRIRKIKWSINKNGCWICTSHSLSSKGYPKRNDRYMSRYMYEKYKGKIPNGLIVRHTCDNPSCINPSHLILGTLADNIQDMVNRNRNVKGEKQWKSKLNSNQVLEIRKLYSTGNYSHTDLSKLFNISRSNSKHIVKKRSWKHI